MSGFTVILIYFVGVIALAYQRAGLRVAAAASAGLLLIQMIFGAGGWLMTLLLLISTAGLAVLSLERLRRRWITQPLFSWYKRALPAISATEREAIDAGTVWWEGELFSGRPDWQKLLSIGRPHLTDAEQAFIDGPVEQLCRMVDSWEINHVLADIPAQVSEFIKSNGFLGMIIPKQYGGLELSTVAQTEVLTKLGGISSVVHTFISVPNSLGPGELLHKYGTEEQKAYYLPRLARGEEIPCFALTSPLAGSDATSIPDTGIVCNGQWQGQEIVGMRLNFDKRYITLSPIATLVGLAFKLSDPEHLIGTVDDYGLTCALIPKATPGLETGRRHLPIGEPFLNGTVRGSNIFVPLDYIIGGREMAGKGWRMLVNCLSTGRVVTLPSISNSLGKYALAGTGAYARIRRQFNQPIAQFEGIQKPLARIAGLSFIINAARLHTAQAVDMGSKPSVASAILKYHCTEMARLLCLDAMDIHGGKSVMKGPANYLAAAYESIPVAITVEGANIMTRSLMIFGQGATRCHPYVLREMEAAAAETSEGSLAEFDSALFGHMGFTLNNGAQALLHGLSGSRFTPAAIDTPTRRYYQHIHRLSAAFALVADAAMLTMQASLKRREMISGRLGDLLSMLYLASMVLKHYEDEGCPSDDLPVVEWACQYLLNRYQQAMHETLLNFPGRLVALKLRFLIFPLGRRFDPPPDRLEVSIANLVTRNTETRRRLIAGIYATPSAQNPLGRLNEVFLMTDDIAPLMRRMRDAVKAGQLPALLGLELINAARQAGVLNEEETLTMQEYDARIMEIIHVDEFAYDTFAREIPKTQTFRKKTTRRKTARNKAAPVGDDVEA